MEEDDTLNARKQSVVEQKSELVGSPAMDSTNSALVLVERVDGVSI
jgi:hypothetical protein